MKENSRPSKEGSTVDKIIVTKASPSTNGAQKQNGNGYCYVKRNDDTLTQLTKLNHSGYGTTEVTSWNNTQSNMVREVDNDQREDRKRHAEDDDDDEMDMGRTKKIKYGIKLQNSSNQGGKLPNPFQEQQNHVNQNGNGGHRQNSYSNNNGNGFSRFYGHNKKNNNFNGSKYSKNQHNNFNNNHNNSNFHGKPNYSNKNNYKGNRHFYSGNNRR